MSFLTWGNQADADTSLVAVDAIYGCPIQNDYTMLTWANVTKSDAENKWGFEKPAAKVGKTIEELEVGLVSGYTELAEVPAGWYPDEGI